MGDNFSALTSLGQQLQQQPVPPPPDINQQPPAPTTGYSSDISNPTAMDLGPPQGAFPGSLPPGAQPPQQAPNFSPSAQEILSRLPQQGQRQTGDWSPENPYAGQAQQLKTQYQQAQPPPPAGGGVKRFLTSWFTTFSDASAAHLGLPTQQQRSQQLFQRAVQSAQLANEWESLNSQVQLRQQQTAASQQEQSQRAQLFPGQLQEQGIRTQAEQFAFDQAKANAPTIANQLPLDETTAKLAGIPAKFVGQNLSVDDWKMVDARLQAQGIQKFDTGQDGRNGGIVLMDRGGNVIKQLTPISESARATALVKMQLGAAKQPVYAYDPQSNQTVLTTQADAQARGMSAVRGVKQTDIEKDIHDQRVLNDIAAKANAVWASSSAMDNTSFGSTAGAAQYLADHPNSTFEQLVNSKVLGSVDQKTQNYLQDVMSLRESSMGLNKVLTGSARVNDVQLNALLRTLPSLEANSGLVKSKLQRFTQNVHLLRQGIPVMPGITQVPIQGENGFGGGDFFSRFGGKPR